MIFVVEDDPLLRRSLVEFLTIKGQPVEGFDAAEPALEAARHNLPDVVISDVQLPGMGGLELLEALGALDPTMVRVAVTAHASLPAAVRAIRGGVYDYLEKPVQLDRLLLVVERAAKERQARRELDWQRNRGRNTGLAQALLGTSPAMDSVRQQVAMLASLQGEPPPVLIMGETGAGKGLVSRLLHDARLGDRKPFIEVNCAALPTHLVEGELFGNEKSAYTDARSARTGLVEAADGGTLLLDEIGELPLDVQAKLLQFLESRQVRRVGGVRTRPVQTTILSATNVSLPSAVAAGRFRADLYHRLAALTLDVPSLRQRGDAVEMAQLLLRDAAVRYRKDVLSLSVPAQQAILAHAWPGNLRELRFAMERAVLLSPAGTTQLPASVLALAAHPEHPATTTVTHPASAGPASSAHVVVTPSGVRVELPPGGAPLEELERAVLKAALEANAGNVVQTARYLALSRDTLRYRVKKFGLEVEDG